MIGEKVSHYQGKNTDLTGLKGKIEDYLKKDGFKVRSSVPSEHGIVIQAQKGGFLRSVIDADRALTIMIEGDSADFTVRIGIGKWMQHLGISWKPFYYRRSSCSSTYRKLFGTSRLKTSCRKP